MSSRPPLYGDFTGMPDNPADAINIYRGAERAFSLLSSEDKLAYNNDFRVWLASLMAGSTSAERPVADTDSAVVENDKESVSNAADPAVLPSK